MVTIAAIYHSNAQAFAALMFLRRALIRKFSRADDVALGRSCYEAQVQGCLPSISIAFVVYWQIPYSVAEHQARI